MRFQILFLYGLLFIFTFMNGCASTYSGENKPSPALSIPQPQPDTQQQAENVEMPKGIQMSSTQPFANRVEWPQAPESYDAPAAYNITSGTSDEVWVEGKGYFHGSLDNVYQDLINEQIIGPTHMTRDIERAEFSQAELKTSYVMHIKMTYILPIRFDMTATLEPIFENGELAGYLYHSEKTGGTAFIKVISDTLLIKKLENNMFSAEFLSVNIATQDREEEARGHAEALFSYWDETGKKRVSSPSKARCEQTKPVAEPVDTQPAQAETMEMPEETKPIQTDAKTDSNEPQSVQTNAE